jgi:hypothetical protein
VQYPERALAFVRTTIAPCLTTVASSPPLLQDFSVYVLDLDAGAPTNSARAEMLELLREGEAETSPILGSVLLIEERDPARRQPVYAGRYMMGPQFHFVGDEVYVSPLVMFQMKFDGKLHKFKHRYDAAIENHRLEDVTSEQILNHVIDSFSFYRMHAFADTKAW